MIYEYPENFIVPVVYDKYLHNMNRNWEFKYMQIEELLMPLEEDKEGKMLHVNKYSKNMSKNYLEMEESQAQKSCTCKSTMYNDCSTLYKELDGDYIKCILSEIDNEYANSETMRI